VALVTVTVVMVVGSPVPRTVCSRLLGGLVAFLTVVGSPVPRTVCSRLLGGLVAFVTAVTGPLRLRLPPVLAR
jgi:hypothetical protein